MTMLASWEHVAKAFEAGEPELTGGWNARAAAMAARGVEGMLYLNSMSFRSNVGHDDRNLRS